MLLCTGWAHAQVCVVLNEVMVNPAGGCDGACVPATAEWVELYNTCDETVDIGCFALTDEDFSVVFPPGTTISPGDFFVIGSPNSGVPIDLDWSTCNCTSSNGTNQVGIFTNGNEQLALFDPSGMWVDGVWWGAGQFDLQSSIVTGALSGCSEQTLQLTADLFVSSALPTQSGNESGSIHRLCDGSPEWVSNAQISPGTSNGGGGTITPSFTLNATEGCSGDCFTLTNTTTGSPTSYQWSLPQGISTEPNPGTFCIENGGTYEVILTISDGCLGNASASQTIQIVNTTAVSIGSPGPLNVCEGEQVQLILQGAANADAVQWFFDGVELTETNDSLTVTNSGTYTALVTWGTCFAFTNEVQVSISDNLLVNIASSIGNVLCPFGSVLLQATPGFEGYQWSLNGELLTNDGSSGYLATQPGVYSVLAASGGCEGLSPDFSLSLAEVDSVNIEVSDVLLCPGESAVLQLPQNAQAYAWLLDNDIIADATSFVFQTTTAGTYTAELLDTNGCVVPVNPVFIDVVGVAPVLVNANGPVEFCEGNSITLSADGDFQSIQWLDNGFVLPGANSANLEVNETGAFSVEVTNADGCVVLSDLFQVFVYPQPIVSVFPEGNINSCFTLNPVQAVVLNNLNGFVQWLDADGQPVPGATGNTFNAPEGIWTLQVTSAEGCVGISAPVEVIVTEPVIPALQLEPIEPCEGDLATLSLVGEFSNINWSIGFTTQSIVIGAPGTYNVVALDVNNCPVQASRLVEFKPLPEVFAGNDTITDCALAVVLNGSGDGQLQWSPANEVSNPNEAVTSVNPDITTTYTLTSNLNGCEASSSVTVVAECPLILIPNVFTPNRNGGNEQLRIIYRGIETFEWKVFNRWGQLMWETTNPDAGWDGDEASEGTYFYTMIALDRAGNSIFDTPGKEGTITLLR
jgi:gliding motility-associated-like protein